VKRKKDGLSIGAPTIADVAKAAGFSPMTVSRVINGEPNVRDNTRAAILIAIERLKYAPNLAARSLAGSNPIRVGILYDNPSATYLSRFMIGSLEQAQISHAQLVLERRDPLQSDESAVRHLLASGVDGIILSPPLCDSPATLELLDRKKTLAVIIANWLPPGSTSVVWMDDIKAAMQMTQHIVSLGHRRIGFITGDSRHNASAQRLTGFRTALHDANIDCRADYIVDGMFTYRSGLAAAEQLLALPEPPTAIFSCNDDMAAAVICVAHRRHLNVPGDLTVCGFDDADFAKVIWPELTTIHQPIEQMARTAVEMLVEQIRTRRSGKPTLRQVALLGHRFVQRESDAPPIGA
jgi:LacI family transcriptional regulator